MGTKSQDVALPVPINELELSFPICRLCMRNGCKNMAPIFHRESAICIAEKIIRVTQLNVYEGDGLPSMVCDHCVPQLDAAHIFIQQCTSSDVSLRSNQKQVVEDRTGASNEEERSSLQQIALPVMSNGVLQAEIARSLSAVQDADFSQQYFGGPFVAPNLEISESDECTELGNVLPANNSMAEVSTNRSIECLSEEHMKNLDIHLLLADPLQMSSELGLVHENVSGKDGMGDNFNAICALVALSSKEIKIEPELPPANAPNPLGNEFQDMPVLEIQVNGVEPINSVDNCSTLIQGSKRIVEMNERNLELENDSIDAIAVAPVPATLTNKKQPDSVGVKFKCPDCLSEYANKWSLDRHTKLRHKQKLRNFNEATGKSTKELIKPQNAHKSKKNLVATTRRLERQHASTVEKYEAHRQGGSSHAQHTEPLNDQQTRVSVQLSQLKRVLIVKLTRLPENFASVTNTVASSTTKKAKTKYRYKCAICSKEYVDKWYLAAHVQIHDEKFNQAERPFKCKKCGNTFRNVPALNAHIRGHSAKRIYECEKCKASFLRMIHLKRHMLIHSDNRPFKCEICNKTFKEVYKLRTHLLAHSPEKPFKCEKCFRAFRREGQFKEHKRQHEQPQKPKPWHKCFVCKSDFLTAQRLEDHLLIHKGKDSDDVSASKPILSEKSAASVEALTGVGKTENHFQSSNSSTKSNFDRMKEIKNSCQTPAKGKEACLFEPSVKQPTADDAKGLSCNICSMMCANQQHFDRHAKTHSYGQRFQCPICKKSYSAAKSLSLHKKLHMETKPSYPCDICKKTFTQPGTVTRHKLLHSTGERPYKCSVCQRGFVTKSALGIHERMHLDHRPFKCEHCDRSYRESYNLMLHMRIHNKERNFKCSQCKAAFHRQSYLHRHMKVHEENRKMYRCDICGKTYLRRRSITGHIKKFHWD